MFMILESFVSIDDELSALLADYAAYIGDDAALPAEPAVAVSVDPATEIPMVIDPMLPDDGAVFGDAPTPTVVDAGVSADPADAAPSVSMLDATAPAQVSIEIDAGAIPQADAADLDLGLDLDTSILFVGRGFGSFSFTDLP